MSRIVPPKPSHWVTAMPLNWAAPRLHYAEEDIRQGQYWTRWPGHDWQPVPEEVVIQNGNPHGTPVVWWYLERGETKIRCYVPGGGV